MNSQEIQDETNKKDYEALSAKGDITIVTVVRSSSERVRLFIELAVNIILVSLSVSAFFIPAIYQEWTNPRAPQLNNGKSHGSYKDNGDGINSLIAIALFWTYSLILVVIRISLIRFSVIPSVPLWSHSTTLYLFAFISYLVTFRSTLIHPYSRQSRIFNITQSIFSTILFINNFSAKIGDAPGQLYVKGNVFPSIEPISSIFSLITYSWIDSTIWTGYLRPLTAKDIWELRIDDHSGAVISAFRKISQKSKSSLIIRLIKYFALPLIISNSWSLIYSLLNFAPPFLLKVILEYVDNPGNTPKSVVWLYVFSFLLCGILTNVVQGQSLYIGRRICIRLRSILIGEIYAKTLRRRATVTKESVLGKKNDVGSKDSDKKKSDNKKSNKKSDKKDDDKKDDKKEDEGQANHGAIINLMSVDTFKVSEICAYIHFVTQAIVVTILCIMFLYLLIGWSAFVGAGSMFVLMPIQFRLSQIYSRSQAKLMAATDSRINKLNEVLQSIRIIKFFAWEKKFAESVLKIREEELHHLRYRYILWTWSTLVYFTIPIFVTILTFATYIFVQQHLLTAPIAFTVLALLNVMRNPLEQLAEILTELLQAKVSLNRIDDFLNERETSKYQQLKQHVNDTDSTASAVPRIGFENATFSWESSDILATSKTDFKLRNIDISFKVGELNVIVGPTGSGKTSLLLALLGEMELVSGSVFLPGGCLRDEVVPNPTTGLAETIAYCSQSAWLLNDTLRNNILFGTEYDHDRYNAIIDACSLRRDLEILDGGDQTEIGEKGITLSGGQKQRVSLARAFYSNSRHLILDDCLSAVDSHTALSIYENCLTGLPAQHRTIILVSHNVSLTITQAAHVIVMDNGRVKDQGLPATLVSQGSLGDDELLTSTNVTRTASSINLQAQNQQYQAQHHRESLTIGEELAAKLLEEPDAEILAEEDEQKLAKFKSRSSQKSSKKRKRGDGKLVSEETKAEGQVSASVYLAYMKALGGRYFWFFLMALFIVQPILDITQSWWIKIWTSAMTERQPNPINGTTTIYQTSQYHVMSNLNRIPESSTIPRIYSYIFYNTLGYLSQKNSYIAETVNSWDADTNHSVFYMVVYIIIGLTYAAFSSFNVLFCFLSGVNASRKIFKKLLYNVLDSKIRFFDSTPIGRIMNRFSKDMESVDQDLSVMAFQVLRCSLGALATTLLIAYITPGFLLFGIFIVAVYWLIGIFYLAVSREIKRIDSISKSPIFQHFGETLSGVSTIRAYGVSNRFIQDNLTKVDNNNRPFFYLWVANRWLSFRIDLAGALVSFSAATMIILKSNSMSAGLAGLSLSYALTFNDYVLWIVRLYAVLEMNMNSVERLMEYMDLEKEPPAVIPSSRPPVGWPNRGEIEVDNLSLRYAPELPMVIKNVTFSVPSFSKIGIVGRTGAGKSTIITAFFRFLEAETGSIKIDGLDISKIGLRDLRQNLAIIPQGKFEIF